MADRIIALLKMMLFVLILASVLTGSLVAVNAYTAPIIEKNVMLKTKKSVLAAFGIDSSGADAEKVFDERVKIVEKGDQAFYVSGDGEVAFKFTGSGLWGPIIGVMAVLPDMKTIKGITVIHQEETPGLGGRIGEADFLASFASKKLVPELLIVGPGKAEKDNEVDGITGATLSCNAFMNILNSEAKRCIPAFGEAKE